MKIPTHLRSLNNIDAIWQRDLQERLVALSIRYAPFAVTQNYTFIPADEIDSLQVDATTAAITVTLPNPVGSRRYRVIKTDASANAVTVSAGATTINGAGTVVLAAQYDYVWVEPTGTAWLIIG